MAGTILINYGTANQSVTCTFATLANASQRQSASVSNASNLFTDCLVQVVAESPSASLATSPYVDVYAYASSNTGTNYSGTCTGSDAAYSGPLTSLVKLGRITFTAINQTFTGGPWSVAMAFGGSLPQQWGLVVDNETGAALQAGSAWFQGVYASYT
jgi:hypothetical protein